MEENAKEQVRKHLRARYTREPTDAEVNELIERETSGRTLDHTPSILPSGLEVLPPDQKAIREEQDKA